MADKSSQLVINALTRAAAAAAAVPWHGSKAAPGLFPATAAGKQAAQRCREEGYLSTASAPVVAEPEGGGTAVKARASAELCTITEKGLAYLFSQVSPRQVLEDMVRVLEAREGQIVQLLGFARSAQVNLEALKANAERVLQQVRASELPAAPATANGDLNALFHAFQGNSTNGTGDSLEQALLAHLTRWSASGSLEDCTLPELFRHVQSVGAGTSIGHFHDALRFLNEKQEIYLHPWTGPLYALPEPPYALLVGHEVAYYASVRSN